MSLIRTGNGLPLAFGAAAVSGVAVFVNGYGVRAVPDATVYTTAKNLVAAAVLTLAGTLAWRVTAGRGRGTTAAGPVLPRRPAQWAGLVAVALIGGSIPFLLFFEGLARASSTHAAFVQKTLVVWVAVLAVPLLAERLRPAHLVAMALIVGGLVVLDGGLRGFRFGDGELLILGATLLWAVEVVLAKRLLGGLPAMTVAVARMGLGVVVLLGWTAASGRWAALAGLGVRGWMWSAVTGLILAGYVALWFTALARARAIDVTAVLCLGAVVTGLLGLAVNGTPIPERAAAGMVALTAGAVVVAAAGLRVRTAGPRAPG